MIPNENDQIVGSIRQLTENEGLAKNTDREIWRKVLDDYYSPSIHVTVDGKIGIDCHGLVCVMPVEKWHDLNAENERLRELLEDGLLLIDSGDGYEIYRKKNDLPFDPDESYYEYVGRLREHWSNRAAEAVKGEKA